MIAGEGTDFERLNITEPTKSGLVDSPYLRSTEDFEPSQQPVVRKVPLSEELIVELTSID